MSSATWELLRQYSEWMPFYIPVLGLQNSHEPAADLHRPPPPLPLAAFPCCTQAGTPPWAVFRLVASCKYRMFYKLKVCGDPAQSKAVNAIFPAAFAHLVSLWHIWGSPAVFQTALTFVWVVCHQPSLLL